MENKNDNKESVTSNCMLERKNGRQTRIGEKEKSWMRKLSSELEVTVLGEKQTR